MCQTNSIKKIFIAIFFVFLISACSTSNNTVLNITRPLYEIPLDWQKDSVRAKTIEDFSKYLKGKKIFIDPGHGGDDRKNKNLKGDVVEADVNLRVALNLRLYFQQAGAKVFMSREKDTTIALADRSVLANNSGADLFVSIHHNAPSKVEDNSTNYTSVYYHSNEKDYEYEPSNRDIAKYVARDLSYVMGNSTGLGSFDGAYSDYDIYPGEGFSVLRKTKIPAILCECAFHTSKLEELRLNIEEFNKIEAWGIFRGIAKYYKAGIPKIELIEDCASYIEQYLKLCFLVTDINGIDKRSIRFFFGKEEKEFIYDQEKNILTVILSSVLPGEYPVKIILANKNGNHALPFRKTIKLDGQKVIIE